MRTPFSVFKTRRPCRLALLLLLAACSDPFEPKSLRTYSGISTGGHHSCAVATDGSAYCWGRNDDGQLGNGTQTNAFTPARVQTDVSFKSITAGDSHTCALAVDGRVYCWGWNAFYQIGVTGSADLRVPQAVATSERFLSVSAGAHHTCAIALDNRVWCWGYNRYGQNGNGRTVTTVPPDPVGSGLRARSVSAGRFHTCAILMTGAAVCWGRNDFGQLGISSDSPMVLDPSAVSTTLQFQAIDAGSTHTCGIANARAYCWGSSEYGEIGDAAPFKLGLPGPTSPSEVILVSDPQAISAGTSKTCASSNSAGTFCWGLGTSGQLGTGNTNNYSVRQPVGLTLAPFPFAQLATDGATHTCGLSEGHIYCWGTGLYGQLGAGPNTITTSPQRIRDQ